MDAARLEAAYAHCDAELKRHDHDRWLADLFLPESCRRHAHALHAFSHEVARVRESVRDALPGEVRLQWWVDAIEGETRGDVTAHPVAAALLDTIRRFSLRRSGLVALVEARRFDLYDDAMPTLTDLEGYAGETASVLFQQVALLLDADAGRAAADASGHAGVAYALTGLMRALPLTARRNQVFLPLDLLGQHGLTADDVRAGQAGPELDAVLADVRAIATRHLDTARREVQALPPTLRPAFAGLGLVRPYLKRLARAAAFGPPVDLPAWRKPIQLWSFARRF